MKCFVPFRKVLIFGFAVLLITSCADTLPLIAVQVEPLCVELAPGETQQFNARLFIDSVDQGLQNSEVTWSVVGGDVNGVVNNDPGTEGFYQAPNTIPPPAAEVQVVATSNEDDQKSGLATVVFTGQCPQ
jgi:hypothetical protein